jgi:hypothetical protein
LTSIQAFQKKQKQKIQAGDRQQKVFGGGHLSCSKMLLRIGKTSRSVTAIEGSNRPKEVESIELSLRIG